MLTALVLMRRLKIAMGYFAIVFGAGFALALVRIPFLVPMLGVRAAELLESTVMLSVIVWASNRLARRHPELSRSARLGVGMSALAFLLAAELTVAGVVDDRPIGAYIASRDPVSGSVYLACLLFFGVAPALWRRPGDRHAPTARWKQPGL